MKIHNYDRSFLILNFSNTTNILTHSMNVTSSILHHIIIFIELIFENPTVDTQQYIARKLINKVMSDLVQFTRYIKPLFLLKYGTSELELKSFFIIFLRTVRVPFSLQHRPKDPGPNNCSLVDWAWFTAAKGAV